MHFSRVNSICTVYILHYSCGILESTLISTIELFFSTEVRNQIKKLSRYRERLHTFFFNELYQWLGLIKLAINSDYKLYIWQESNV